MAKKQFNPKEIKGEKITSRQADLIREQFDKLKEEGRIASNASYEKWFYKNEEALNLFYNQEVRQAVDYSNNYLIKEARDFDEVKVNNREVGADGLERAIDRFENFVYGTIEGVSNIRYSPAITIKQNKINQEIPKIDELQELSEAVEGGEDLYEIFQRWKEQYGVVIYYSPLK